MSFAFLAVATCVAFVVLRPQLSQGADSSRSNPLVFAHYMHCYVLGGIPGNDDRVLHPAKLRQLETWPSLTEESSWFTPELSAVAADGLHSVRLDFDMAERTGINDFGLLLGPKMLPTSAYSPSIHMLAATARIHRVKIIPEIWGDLWGDDYANFGINVKTWFDRYPNAFQLRDGKPVLVFAVSYSAEHNSVEQQRLAATNMQAFLQAWGGPEHVYKLVYLPYELSVAMASPLVQSADAVDVWTPQDDWSALHSGVAEQAGTALGKLFAFPVTPAFYQRRAGLKPWEYGNSFGAARYIDSWFKAVDEHPAFVDIQTWNDFSEDSGVTKTNTAGEAFLHLTQYGIQLVRNGKEPTVDTERLMLFHPKQLVRAALNDEQALTNNAAWRHSTPIADYLHCVTLLRKPGHLTIELGEQLWQMDVPAGLHEWLIYAPSSVPPDRPGQVVVGPRSFPSSSTRRTVTAIPQIAAASPRASLCRDGKTLMNVQSRLPFLADGPFQDFTIIADEAETPWLE